LCKRAGVRQGKGKREKGKTFILKPFPSFPVTTLFSIIIKLWQKKSNQKSRNERFVNDFIMNGKIWRM
jgi:hypothetical protein